MIRLYKNGDLDKIECNEYTDTSLFGDKLKLILDKYSTYVVEDNGENIAIMSFHEYTDYCYSGFFICSKKFDGQHARQFKRFIDDYVKDFTVKRIETFSRDIDTINRMHEFLGFKCVGKKTKFFKDKDYKIWEIIYGY